MNQLKANLEQIQTNVIDSLSKFPLESESIIETYVSSDHLNIIDFVKNEVILTDIQVRSYMLSNLTNLINGNHTFNCEEICQKDLSDVIQYLVSQLNTPPVSVSEISPLQLNDHLKNFDRIADDENLILIPKTDEKPYNQWKLQFEKILQLDSLTVFDIGIIQKSNEPQQSDLQLCKYLANINNESSQRNYKVINCPNRIPQTIIYTFINNVLEMATEYNSDMVKHGSQYQYSNGQLRQIYGYQNGDLSGCFHYILNNQVVMSVPFEKNLPHGTLQMIDTDRKTVYSEIYYKGAKLLVKLG